MHTWQDTGRILSKYLFICIILVGLCCFDGRLVHADPKMVRVGVYDNAPIVFRERNGGFGGFSVDILRHIARKEGWILTFVYGTWSECLSRLANGDIDIQVYIAYSPERSMIYDFSKVTLMRNWGQVFSRQEEHLSSIFDLDSKRVAVLDHGIHAIAFKNLVDKFGINATFIPLESHQKVFQRIRDKEVDVGIANRIFGMRHSQQYGLYSSMIVFNPIDIRYAARKGTNDDILAAIDKYLSKWKMQKDSIYYKLRNASLPGFYSANTSNWVWWGFTGIAAFCILILISIRKLLPSKARMALNNEIIAKMAEGVHLVRLSDLRIVYANSKLEQMFGYDPGEILGKNVCIINSCSDQSSEQTVEEILAVLHESGEWHGEVSNSKKDGTQFWSYANVSIFNHLVYGKVLVSVHSDITEKKMADAILMQEETERRSIENKLLESSEARFQNAVYNAPFPIMLHADGDVLAISKTWTELSGYTLDEIPTIADWTEKAYGEQKYKLRKVIKDLYQLQMRKDEGDFNILTKDGRELVWSFSSSPLGVISDGRRLVISMAMDITNAQATSKQLAKSNAMLETIINQAPFGIHVAEGSSASWHITISNREVERITGATSQEMEQIIFLRGKLTAHVKLACTLLYPDRSPWQPGNEPLTQAMRGNTCENVEMIILRANGDESVLLINSAPIYDDGQVIAGIVTYSDITSRKLLEDHLRQAQKMQAVGTLAGGVAHDFNNILAIILGNAELAELGVGDTRTSMNSIKTAVLRGKDLVRQLLTFSRRSPGQKQLLDAIPLIKEALQLVRSTLPSSIEILTRIQQQSIYFEGDPIRLHQIVVNLCMNASQALGEEGGILEVGLKQVALSSNAARALGLSAGDYMELIVQDNGPGIPLHLQERIFEPFFTTKDTGKGCGLGLSVVHGVTEEYNGCVLLESKPNTGAEFTVYLPAADALPEAPNDIGGDELLAVAAGRIIFVDDEPDLVVVGVEMLELLGYNAIGFTDSQKAVAAFQQSPDSFDAVVTDQVMPHLSGCELASQIHKIRSSIPIFLCTGFSEKITEENAAEMGVHAFFLKPVSIGDLSRALVEVFQQGK